MNSNGAALIWLISPTGSKASRTLRRSFARWGKQAEALAWTTADLFGLAPVPDRPPANYRRLSRYDLTGLLWLLRGRPVVALTTTTAAIQAPSGAILTYRRHRKPPLGPLGDSLEDMAALELGLIDDEGGEDE